MLHFNPSVRNPSYERTKAFRTNPPIWANWEYDPTEWAAFDAWEWKQAKRAVWQGLWPYILLALLGLIVVAGFAAYAQDSTWLVFSCVPLWLFGVVGLLNGWAKYAPAARLHHARQHGKRSVTITPISLQQADTAVSLVDRQLVLRKVWVTEREHLILHFHRTYYRRGATQSEIRVPIPRARLDDASHLVEQFYDHVI